MADPMELTIYTAKGCADELAQALSNIDQYVSRHVQRLLSIRSCCVEMDEHSVPETRVFLNDAELPQADLRSVIDAVHKQALSPQQDLVPSSY